MRPAPEHRALGAKHHPIPTACRTIPGPGIGADAADTAALRRFTAPASESPQKDAGGGCFVGEG